VAREHPSPLVVRLAHGRITDARSSVVVVSHFNGLQLSGAQADVDAALGGTLSRRALDGHFGAVSYFPARTARLAADGVLVLGLGEVEKLTPDRLPELGYALVDALAAFGLPSAATVVHGASALEQPAGELACRLLEGVFEAVDRLPGAEHIHELTVVECDAERLEEIRTGIRAARAPTRVHLYLEAEVLSAGPAPPAGPAADGPPAHLRLGLQRAGPTLKVTVAQEEFTIRSDERDWPEEVEARLVDRIDSEILRETDDAARGRAMVAVGGQLFEAFLGWTNLDLPARLRATRGDYLVLGCDQMTVRLPWELLHDGEQFLSRSHRLSRQLEIGGPGRTAAWPPADGRLKVLVVGDPQGNLPGAAREAKAIAKALRGLPGSHVKLLESPVSWGKLSRALNEDWDVLHYAGHAAYDEERHGASGLILQDGTLTADDLSTRRYLPRLVVANACQSAKSDGDLFDGAPPTRDLVAGLLGAGARAVVGSMWKVGDAAAATFGTSFYAALAGGAAGAPTPVGDAVAAARAAVAREHPDDPAWGGYALYGSPWKPALTPDG